MDSDVEEESTSSVFTPDEDKILTLSRTRTEENNETGDAPGASADKTGVAGESQEVGAGLSPPAKDASVVTPPYAPTSELSKETQQATISRPPLQIKSSDFLFGTTLGEGSFARVVHCRLKSMQRDYAMKILEKAFIKKQKKVNTVLMEKDILIRYSHPMIIKLYYCFTDSNYIYMCMDLAAGGELGRVIDAGRRHKQSQGISGQACDVRTTQFYIAELVEALEYLHAKRIVHRDLKPENVLLTAEGHIKVADFGTALVGDDEDNSFEGTALYVSPEVLNSAPATKSCDLWALGCIMYHMLTGSTPFHGDTEYLIFEKLQNYVAGTYQPTYASHMSPEAKDLVMKLLHVDPGKRIGGGVDNPDDEANCNGYGTLKGHPFFDGVAWGHLLQTVPPYTPDSSQFPDPAALTDGADDEWMLGGEATIINQKPSRAESTSNDVSPFDLAGSGSSAGRYGGYDDRRGGEKVNAASAAAGIGINSSSGSSSTNAGQGKAAADASEAWRSFLLKGENQLFTGLTVKRKGLFSKQRRLVLTDLPRLFYVDPDSKELKGEIPWTAEYPVKCTIVDDWKFDVLATQSNRVYHLLDREVGSTVWVDLINAMVEKQATERHVKGAGK